jgi:hypothetical protein
MNPRYAAYAKAHGRDAEHQMAHDQATWPGGYMCGFVLWISGQKQAFWRACPSAFLDRYSSDTIRDQAAWTTFLQSAGDGRGVTWRPVAAWERAGDRAQR